MSDPFSGELEAAGTVPVQPASAEATSRVDVSYEQASERLDAIVRRLDSGDCGLRETLELCQEAKRLVEFCAGELEAVGQGLEELRLDELVARLEPGSRRG